MSASARAQAQRTSREGATGAKALELTGKIPSPPSPLRAPQSDQAQWVPLECACGQAKGQYLKHYELCRCVCGRFYWALQPHRDGPLVAMLWPGDARTGPTKDGFPQGASARPQ
jgi:hypothetical protein